MVQILPAILDTEEESFKNHIIQLNQATSFKEGWVHIDFMDNKFVPNKSISPLVIAKYPIKLKKEAHLMVSHPKDLIDQLVKTGFKRIVFHIESKDDTNEVIDKIKSKGLEVGLAINMDTPMEKLQEFVSKIDVILIMSIVPGFQGQPFIKESLDRVREIKSKNWPVKIGVDGAVRDNNIKQIVEAGVDYVTVGSFLLKGRLDKNLKKLWEALS